MPFTLKHPSFLKVLFFSFALFSSHLGSAQITLNACDAVLGELLATGPGPQNHNLFHTPAQDVGSRRTYISSPHLGCSALGGGFCPLRIIWGTTTVPNRWEIQIDATGLGTFAPGATFTLFYNEAASTPNPPDLTLGTWVENAAITGGACGGSLSAPDILTGDVQSSLTSGLPIELVHFNGFVLAQEIFLEWTTITETNNHYFAIEHSTNLDQFRTIDTLHGQGTSTQEVQYDFIHVFPSLGPNYYRLKQVDFDGSIDYSEIIHIRYENESKQTQVFPSPATHSINVIKNPLHQHEKHVSYTITSLAGQDIKSGMLSDTQQSSITISELQSGVYFLNVSYNTFSETIRFVKK